MSSPTDYPESIFEPAPRPAGTTEGADRDPSTGSQAPEVVGICTSFTRRPPLVSGTISVPPTIPYAIELGVAFSLNHYTETALGWHHHRRDRKVTSASAEGLNSVIQWLQSSARGFRNRERFKNAIYFHLGGLELYPAGVSRSR